MVHESGAVFFSRRVSIIEEAIVQPHIAGVRRIDRQAFEGVFGRTPEEARDWLDASPTLVPQANASR